MNDQKIAECIAFVRTHVPLNSRPSREGPPTQVVRIARKAGKVVQDCDVYIGRRCTMGGWDLPQSKWANPFPVRECPGGVRESVDRFTSYLLENPVLLCKIPELRGKRLGCWCKRTPSDLCHGDVLAAIANAIDQ